MAISPKVVSNTSTTNFSSQPCGAAAASALAHALRRMKRVAERNPPTGVGAFQTRSTTPSPPAAPRKGLQAVEADRRQRAGGLFHHRSAGSGRRREDQEARRAGAHAGQLRRALSVYS